MFYSLSVGFDQFLGNTAVVRRLREAVGAARIPPAMILAGPRGAGKYTLAVMLTQAMACLQHPITDGLPDFCGICSNCTRIALSLPLSDRMSEALAARDELREVDKKETRVLIQTHPDLLVIPPDPPQLLIKIGQVRSVIGRIYRLPAEAPSSMYIFTGTAFMKEAANSLLKILEEPPEYAHLIILAENPGELLPTIRSRCSLIHLAAVPASDIEALLAGRRPDWKPRDRALVARLACGAIGQALSFDLPGYFASRQDALTVLHVAMGERVEGQAGTLRAAEADHGALFRMTDTYRAGAEGQEKTMGLLRAFCSLLEDLLLLQAGVGERIRNIDLASELTGIAQNLSPGWIENAARAAGDVEKGMRRNLLRSLALDAFALGLQGAN